MRRVRADLGHLQKASLCLQAMLNAEAEAEAEGEAAADAASSSPTETSPPSEVRCPRLQVVLRLIGWPSAFQSRAVTSLAFWERFDKGSNQEFYTVFVLTHCHFAFRVQRLSRRLEPKNAAPEAR